MSQSPNPPLRALEVDESGERPVLRGTLDIRTLADATAILRQWTKGKSRTLDLGDLDALDTPGALVLRALRERDVTLTGIKPAHRTLLDLVCGLDLKPLPRPRATPGWRRLIIQLGKAPTKPGTT